mmetsp:Transcript_13420/g.38324  ORF Transcript_13420/g.38324 Transcript_13420/m.38324 type:complete len:144 (+) Transcript_13420:702-1133(+)
MATVTLERRVETLNLPEFPMTSKQNVYWLGAADGIDDGAGLGAADGRLDCVGSRLGNTDGSTETVGSRLGNDDGLSGVVGPELGNDDTDETGLGPKERLGRPEGPDDMLGKAEGLSDRVGAADGKAEDIAVEKRVGITIVLYM